MSIAAQEQGANFNGFSIRVKPLSDIFLKNSDFFKPNSNLIIC